MAQEIARRIAAGPYKSADELLTDALRAIDGAHETAEAILERELLKGFEGNDVEMTAADWDDIEREAIKVLDSKKAQ